MNIFSKKLLARILPVDWEQPLLEANGNYGVDEFAVKSSLGTAWHAFSSASGYDGHCISGYADQRPWDVYLYMATNKPILVSGYSLYFSRQGSTAANSVNATGTFYGSDDGEAWIELSSSSTISSSLINSGYTFSKTFSNDKYYKYYRLRIHNNGYSYADAMFISSVRLTAKYEDFV